MLIAGLDVAKVSAAGRLLRYFLAALGVLVLGCDWFGAGPDGESGYMVAFTSYQGPVSESLYAIRADGTDQILLASFALADCVEPAWSPDAEQIAFYSGEGYDIYAVDTDGENLVNLTNHPAIDTAPAWSPDGSRIAFRTDRDGNLEIYAMDRDGGNPQNLTNHPDTDGWPVWSPDGSRIAYTRERYLYIMDAEGANQTLLAENVIRCRCIAWSPDGQRLAFVVGTDETTITWEIFTINIDGTGLEQVTHNYAMDLYPDWSPDGEKIVFVSYRDGYEAVYIMDADGSGQQNLTPDLEDASRPRWSPDGKHILFTAGIPFKIYIMRPDGSHRRRLTQQDESALERYAVWSPVPVP